MIAKSQVPIVLTPGDPAGIGPDLAVEFSCNSTISRPLIIVADRDVLEKRAKLLGLNPDFHNYENHSSDHPVRVLHIDCPSSVVPGTPNTQNSEYVLNTIDVATAGCMDGSFAALVTGPANKQTMMRADIDFQGAY